MEIVKDIATVIGCITGCIGLLTALCRPLRKFLIEWVQRISGKSKVENQLTEIKKILEKQAEDQLAFQAKVEASLNIALEFTEKQCRSDIKEIFYTYRDVKRLPLYEKKALMDIEELYIKKLNKNHWGKTLLEEMATWDVDPSNGKTLDFSDE